MMKNSATTLPAVLLAMTLGAATAKGQVYQHFAHYNESELPGRPISSSWSSVYGVFFYPTLPISPVFTIERMRFWHFDSNEDPDPFLVHVVVRNTGAEHIYLISTIENLWTTCTNCWEEVEIEMSFADASTPGWSFGVLMQPQGGFLTNAEPMIRRDSGPSVPLVNLYAHHSESSGFFNLLYLENYGGGNYFMEVIVRYDVTGAAVTSLSAIKALY
jgi:hypothetical protein